MIIEDISSLNLHDSELISVNVRTTDEGDENILLRLNYLIDYQSSESNHMVLVFEKCWSARLTMNFRVVGPDSIQTAEEIGDSDFINEIRGKWASISPMPSTRLRHYKVTTSLSGSELNIVAEQVRLIDARAAKAIL